MRLLLAVLVALFVCVAVSSCGGDSGSGEPQVSTFTLISANDQRLPATVFDGMIDSDEPAEDFHLQIVATEGYLRLNRDGTYEQKVIHIATIDGNPQPRVLWTDRGDYRDMGGSLEFDSNFIQNVHFTATRSENELRVTTDMVRENRPVPYIYRE